jgi:polyisoprenoid-binding protein YceI
MRYDPSNAECTVLTFKEGLLSKIAHDLRIRIGKFEIEVDDATRAVRARFDTSSLAVVTARQKSADAPSLLAMSDKRRIEATIRDDVLHSAKHPEATFASKEVRATGESFEVNGELALHGKTRALRAIVRPEGAGWLTQVQIHQPDYGIEPYSALMGTLKVQPVVTVRVTTKSR